MKLYKVREAATWVDPFGDLHQNEIKYVLVLEVVEPTPTGQFRHLTTGYSGEGQDWDAEVIGVDDGRTWLPVQNRVDYWGGTWYRPLFEEPRDPALLQHEVGPRVAWLSEKDMKSKRCVNRDGRAVDLEGNLL